MSIAFDAVTAKKASVIAVRLAELPTSVGGLQFVGEWVGRRFVIRNLLPAMGEVHSVSKDFAAGTITIPRPVLLSEAECVRELRSFGASITRRSQSGLFDIVAGSDHETHFVAAAHHVALCGHRGPWPDTAHPPSMTVSCSVCAKISESKPNHRARLHPRAPGNQR